MVFHAANHTTPGESIRHLPVTQVPLHGSVHVLKWSEMAKQHDMQTLAAVLAEIPQAIATCRRVASALIEIGKRWTSTAWHLLDLFPTEYDRARGQILRQCGQILPGLRRIRVRALSPEAIRASHYVETIRDCCRRCRSHNLSRMRKQEAFSCLTQRELSSRATGSFRFSLGKEGQIIETD